MVLIGQKVRENSYVLKKVFLFVKYFFIWLKNEALGLDLRFAKMLIYITFKTVSFVFWPCN